MKRAKGQRRDHPGYHPEILERREYTNSTMYAPFTLEETRRAILRSGLTSLGKDEIYYIM